LVGDIGLALRDDFDFESDFDFDFDFDFALDFDTALDRALWFEPECLLRFDPFDADRYCSRCGPPPWSSP